MSLRNFIGNKVRRLLGRDVYTRLRIGTQFEHSYLWRVHGVIHIGANTGQERELYAAFGLPVIWIEPIPEVFVELVRNISSFPKQRALNYLVVDDDGKDYQLNVANNGGASSSIFEFSKHKEFWPEIEYTSAITVRGITLESLLRAERVDIVRFDALVLDTQGSELKIMMGAANLLSNFKFIKVEAPDFESYVGCCRLDEISSLLEGKGFRERSRHLQIQRPGVGSYFDVIYKRSRTTASPL